MTRKSDSSYFVCIPSDVAFTALHSFMRLFAAVMFFHRLFSFRKYFPSLVLILLLVSGVLSRPLTIIDNAVLSGMQTVIFNLLSLLVHTGNAMSGVL